MRNKKYIISLLLLFVFFSSSCSVNKNNETNGHPFIDGLVFNQFKNFEHEDTTYQISLSIDENAPFYTYQEFEYKTRASSWIINYYYESEYIVDSNFNLDDEVILELYELMMDEKNNIENLLGYTIDIYSPFEKYEKEIEINNKFNDEIGCVFFDKYIPIRIKNMNNNKSNTISIPIQRKYLVKYNDMIESPVEDKFIKWEDFLAIPNLKK